MLSETRRNLGSVAISVCSLGELPKDRLMSTSWLSLSVICDHTSLFCRVYRVTKCNKSG